MAGFFGLFDYTKEGPGIDPDAPPKGALATFFGIWGRKFWKVMGLSLMYTFFSIPTLVIAFFVATFLMGHFGPNFDRLVQGIQDMNQGQAMPEGMTPELLAGSLVVGLILVVIFVLVGLSYVVLGPVHAGLTYVLRNYAREEHAFIWSDFWEHARKNWKQATATMALSILTAVLLPLAFRFYLTQIAQPILRTVLATLMIIIALLWTFMLMYLYQMMITIELSFKNLLRNAFLFAIFRLPFNLLILLAQLFILAGIPLLLQLFLGSLGMLIGTAYILLIGWGLNFLLVNFYINRQIKRFLIERIEGEFEAPEPKYYWAEDEEESTKAEDAEEDEDESPQTLPEPETHASPA